MGRNRVSEEWKSIRKKLNDDEFRYFKIAMTVMYTDGFKAGYEMASQERWILAEDKQPQTEEKVEVTVLRGSGKLVVAKSRYINGEWKDIKDQTRVVAWRPAVKPCKVSPETD